MSREELIAFLGEDWVRTQDIIRRALVSQIPYLQQINDGVCSRSGKQLRPMVSLLVARLCTGAELPVDSCHFAAASELLHNATLLHDDVADRSSQRRGKPTLVSLIGPTAAVLVGDFWLSRAMEEVLKTKDHERVVQLFSKTLCDLAEGEILQLQNAETCATGMDDYLRVIYCKTSSLFEASCLSGAYSVGASPEQEEAVKEYARALGNAFQIKDDILDYFGGEALGKPVGADIRDRKITLPLLGAIANAPLQEERIRSLVREVPSHPENCEIVKAFVLENGGVDYASGILNGYVRKAVRALEIFEDSPQKDYLAQIAGYNSSRQI